MTQLLEKLTASLTAVARRWPRRDLGCPFRAIARYQIWKRVRPLRQFLRLRLVGFKRRPVFLQGSSSSKPVV